jgi:hypothetical protein
VERYLLDVEYNVAQFGDLFRESPLAALALAKYVILSFVKSNSSHPSVLDIGIPFGSGHQVRSKDSSAFQNTTRRYTPIVRIFLVETENTVKSGVAVGGIGGADSRIASANHLGH